MLVHAWPDTGCVRVERISDGLALITDAVLIFILHKTGSLSVLLNDRVRVIARQPQHRTCDSSSDVGQFACRIAELGRISLINILLILSLFFLNRTLFLNIIVVCLYQHSVIKRNTV